jgi:hypothetical protein
VASIERRRAKDGTISYRARVRLRGEKARTRTFKRKTDAEAWARAAETDLSRGLYVPVSKDRKRTRSDLIDRTIEDHLPTKRNNKSAHKVEAYLEWWRTELGDTSGSGPAWSRTRRSSCSSQQMEQKFFGWRELTDLIQPKG